MSCSRLELLAFALRSAPLVVALAVGASGCPSPARQAASTRPDVPQPLPAGVSSSSSEAQAQAQAAPTEVVDLTPVESAQARADREAAELRAREEAELKAKEAERLAAEERRKASEARLKELFDGALTSLQAGSEADAIASFEKAAADQPDSYAALFNLGVLFERKGERDRAIDAYSRALAVKPDYEQASDNITRLYLRGNQLQRADSELRKRILQFPRVPAFRNHLARVMIAQGREEEAERQAKGVLRIDELNVEARLQLATIWYRQGKFELVKQVLDDAKEIDPKNPAVWNLHAFALLRLDLKPLALESFRKAADLREDFPEAHNNLGALLNEVNDCDAARRELELAVRYAPDYAEAHMNLGNAYRCSRQYDRAQAQYEKALELDARAPEPFFNLAILYLDGEINGIEKLARLEKSLGYFDRYRAQGGDDPRTDRYVVEAKKGLEKEQARLERLREQERKSKEKAELAERKKRENEEKARLETERKRAEIDRLKVAGRADFDDEPTTPPPTPTPAAPPALSESVAPSSPPPGASPLRLEKMGPREDLE
jgi:Flp pilus assembly protein TadD